MTLSKAPGPQDSQSQKSREQKEEQGALGKSLLSTPGPWFWIFFVTGSILCGVTSYCLFPRAFQFVSLDITMDRGQALREAHRLAMENHWGPSGISGEVASFGGDKTLQAFVELEGGGKEALREGEKLGLIEPFLWSVHHFKSGENTQTTIYFTPNGNPYGFFERLQENSISATLTSDAAIKIAEDAAQSSPWLIDFRYYKLVETSQDKRIEGRTDHTFIYESPDHKLGGGRYRLSLTVAGNRLAGLYRFVKIPESFLRKYSEMRSFNDSIASVSGIIALVGYILMGCGAGIFFLLQRKRNQWHQPLVVAAVLVALSGLGSLNAWPLVWLDYDTAQSTSSFIVSQLVTLLGGVLATGAVYFFVAMVAEGLTRCAFPHHPQLWRLWSAKSAASDPILVRTLIAYLLTPFWLAYVLFFYFCTTRWLGWWSPMETLANPNILAHYQPWFTPFVNAAKAGCTEELLFRAVPLAGAALLGERWGRRNFWIGAALLVQAVVFGCAHANYPGQPAYSRIVELFVPSLIFGLLYLRFGLLPTVLIHFLYDLMLMSLSLFSTSAHGIWIDRAMVMLLALAPVGPILWQRWKIGRRAELEPGLLNSGWRSELAPFNSSAISAMAEKPKLTSIPLLNLAPGASRPWVLSTGVAIGALTLIFILGKTTDNEQKLHLDLSPTDAERIARAALAERKVSIPPNWRVLSRIIAEEDQAAHRFIWQTAGRNKYGTLLKTGHLNEPSWFVRFVCFQDDVAARAEEWNVMVTNDEKVQVGHKVPEARSGASLSEDEARSRVLEHLAQNEYLKPNDVQEISVTPNQLAHRTDWIFVFRETGGLKLPRGELRDIISLAGDEIVGARRFVFVPDDWRRAQRQLETYIGIGKTIGLLAVVPWLLACVGAALVALSKRQFETREARIAAGITLTCIAASAFNQWPAAIASLTSAKPLLMQQVMLVINTIVVVPVTVTILMGLLTGLTFSWIRMLPHRPLQTSPAMWVSGVCLGLAIAGAVTILRFVHAGAEPEWPSFSGAQAAWPFLTLPLYAATNFMAYMVTSLLFVVSLDRFTTGWSRQRVRYGIVALLLAAMVAQNGTAATFQQWLIPTLVAGSAIVLTCVFVIRRQFQILPIALGTERTIHFAVDGIQRAYPDAYLGAIVAIFVVAILTWWWVAALRRVMNKNVET